MAFNGRYKYFVNNVLQWNEKYNMRQMPWKGEKDPYKIWLSEIILQQTRVVQGLNYYNRFIQHFPTIHILANTSENEIFKLWEGLGYYSRCKNLITSAKYISTELNGVFPDKYETILQLKGVGPYTAAAISSFAFNLPHAVVDGNVFRVLSRYFGILTPVDSTAGKKLFTKLANELLDKQFPAIYNQALMDFGAVICKPQIPLCSDCVLKTECKAYKNSMVKILPVKQNKIIRKNRWFYYFIIEHDGRQYVRKRGAKDIWENLYEFVLFENDKPLLIENLQNFPELNNFLGQSSFEILYISPLYKQLLTHQIIQGQFIKIKVSKPFTYGNYEAMLTEDIIHLPFPKFIAGYLKDKNVSLNLF